MTHASVLPGRSPRHLLDRPGPTSSGTRRDSNARQWGPHGTRSTSPDRARRALHLDLLLEYDDMLAGQPVDTPRAEAVGCFIEDLK